jgi:hypothetical protein
MSATPVHRTSATALPAAVAVVSGILAATLAIVGLSMSATGL